MSVKATAVIHPVPKAISIVARATPATIQEARVSIKRRLAPNFPRSLHHEAQLGCLLVERKPRAVLVAGEAALGTDRQPLQRYELRCEFYLALELVLVLELRLFGRHQAEHHVPALRHEAQRLEAAGALAVELEEERVDFQGAERLLGDAFVAARGDPLAEGVAAAHVHADGHVLRARAHHAVDERDV